MENSKQLEKVIVGILVENNAGVLSRVAGMFGRRGYNIDSLTVSETNDPRISRITISTHGDEKIIEQILLQTQKLIEVKSVHLQDDRTSIRRELLLVKLKADEKNRTAIREVCDIYKANIVDLSPASLVVELTGKPAKIDGFLEVIGSFTIVELCRTGVTSIDRGANVMHCEDTRDSFHYLP